MSTKTTTSEIIIDKSGASIEVFPVEASEDTLFQLFRDIFENYWGQIRFGPIIEGAAWEVAAPNAPTKISLLDGYLTVDFGPWHFHICIGENRGTKKHPTPEYLKKQRKCSRAEFYRRLNDNGEPVSWGFRTYNGKGEQQITVFFPNPHYDILPRFMRHSQPKWEKLEMWNTLRKKYLGLEPDEKDRKGTFSSN